MKREYLKRLGGLGGSEERHQQKSKLQRQQKGKIATLPTFRFRAAKLRRAPLMAPANIVSTLPQVKMMVPHCPGYGNLQ